MDQAPTGLLRLNLETQSFHHDADQGWLGLLQPNVTREEYIRCLTATYGFEAPLESALAYTPDLKQYIDLRHRTRAGLIASDLLSLGMRASEISELPQCLIAPFEGPIEALGWMYVTERATFIHEWVRQHLLVRLPDVKDACSYLLAHDGVASTRWTEFGRVIERVARSQRDLVTLKEAATNALRVLSQWTNREQSFARGA